MWIMDNTETYGLDRPDGMSDSDLVSIILSDKDSTPSKKECELITQSLNGEPYTPDGLDDIQEKRLNALRELVNRFGIRKKVTLRTPNDIYQYIKHYSYEDQEHLIVMAFNGNMELLKCTVATKGLADRTVIHPREVFSECIKLKGTSIVIAHNHPSGRLCPSENDSVLTEKIVEAGKLLSIKVVDHLIITPEGYYSFREMGDMQ